LHSEDSYQNLITRRNYPLQSVHYITTHKPEPFLLPTDAHNVKKT